MINLPDVIRVIPELILGEPALPARQHKPEYEVKLDLNIKKIVLCITRDLSSEDQALFTQYGRLVEYNDRIHANLPIDSYPWEYLVFDLRKSEDRYALMRMVLPYRENYRVIVYSYKFESDEIVPDADNHLSSFPKIQAKKVDFENLLLQKRIAKPRCWVSLFACILNAYHSVKK
jgi:hypothetical protein